MIVKCIRWLIRFITQTLSILLGLLFCSVKNRRICIVINLIHDLRRITKVSTVSFDCGKKPSPAILNSIALGNKKRERDEIVRRLMHGINCELSFVSLISCLAVIRCYAFYFGNVFYYVISVDEVVNEIKLVVSSAGRGFIIKNLDIRSCVIRVAFLSMVIFFRLKENFKLHFVCIKIDMLYNNANIYSLTKGQQIEL